MRPIVRLEIRLDGPDRPTARPRCPACGVCYQIGCSAPEDVEPPYELAPFVCPCDEVRWRPCVLGYALNPTGEKPALETPFIDVIEPLDRDYLAPAARPADPTPPFDDPLL